MDIFSKKTQQFVQKVRPKSVHITKNGDSNGLQNNQQAQSSSDELSHSNTIESDSIENEQNVSDNSSSFNNSSNMSSFTMYQRNFLSNAKSPINNNKPSAIDDLKLNGTITF